MFEQLFGENCSACEGGDEFEGDIEESDVVGQASSSKTKVGSKRKFRVSWRFYNPWVLPGSKDGQLVVKCNVCKSAKKRNIFATTGSDVMHLGAFRKHERINQHQNAERILEKL